ncbi:hypothetical protein TcasGA2_TC010514 [Tribolium castaneum]|uniref:Uncharacterized protein n=1 Tax=Tribolium castaneum TaxID=7070 RepID=D6WDZ2_TRICA|nr:hypothetical protein TcasGA2_TC010514 [Tribolium castaneum]
MCETCFRSAEAKSLHKCLQNFGCIYFIDDLPYFHCQEHMARFTSRKSALIYCKINQIMQQRKMESFRGRGRKWAPMERKLQLVNTAVITPILILCYRVRDFSATSGLFPCFAFRNRFLVPPWHLVARQKPPKNEKWRVREHIKISQRQFCFLHPLGLEIFHKLISLELTNQHKATNTISGTKQNFLKTKEHKLNRQIKH